ncbi:hypothetical protein [Stenotrophomonas phage vB_SmaS_BUCT548]|uniref:DNA-binding phage zinc finger domain-containing protein n=1 Tax=Stenotrophomonas phage vB_SmaS_BUCT548 TaxID=2712941 RepID=A0A7D2LQZ8_9CAUD|nr:hypothetical protein PQD75_gp066 [Stenotrophomonas phage vB_SmaS_BUCT548]QIQ60806.1 hypothetical protein [Stenotrophomonas phage vB_SmaS_BUCT548]
MKPNDVTCPVCKAKAGNWCVKANGLRLGHTHKTRVKESRK